MKNVAIILAAGQGSRLGLHKPKQFLKISGKTILEHVVDVFNKHDRIDEIAIVAKNQYVYDIENMIEKNEWGKVRKIISGGKERYESTLSAIAAYRDSEESVNLIVHDAVRPLVSGRIISDVCDKLLEFEAVDVVVPSVDTLVEVDADAKYIKSIPNRSLLRRGQTPQGFRLSCLQKAYEIGLKDPYFRVSDDCGVVNKYLPEIPIAIVMGENRNIKLTYPEDIYLLDKLFQIKSCEPKIRKLENLTGKVLVVFGGGRNRAGHYKFSKEIWRKSFLFLENEWRRY